MVPLKSLLSQAFTLPWQVIPLQKGTEYHKKAKQDKNQGSNLIQRTIHVNFHHNAIFTISKENNIGERYFYGTIYEAFVDPSIGSH